jgi:hypothetical protein
MNIYLGILVVGLAAALVVQAVVMRARYRRKLAGLQAGHMQAKRDADGRFEQARHQIGQLQTDLTAARQQLKQLGKSATAPARVDPAAARRALERELDDAAADRHELPANGFADTQVAVQDTQHGSLLFQ